MTFLCSLLLVWIALNSMTVRGHTSHIIPRLAWRLECHTFLTNGVKNLQLFKYSWTAPNCPIIPLVYLVTKSLFGELWNVGISSVFCLFVSVCIGSRVFYWGRDEVSLHLAAGLCPLPWISYRNAVARPPVFRSSGPRRCMGFPSPDVLCVQVLSLIHALSEDKDAFTFPTERAGLIVREFKSPMVLRGQHMF